MSADFRAQASRKCKTRVKAARQELEKTRTRIMKETCTVFESTEKIWRSMGCPGSTNRSLGFGVWGAVEQKTGLRRSPAYSSSGASPLLKGRSCPCATASGSAKA